MDIFLVGGISANLKPLWQKAYLKGGAEMIIALAGCFSSPWCIDAWYKARGILEAKDGDEETKAFCLEPDAQGVPKNKGIHILESFFYADEWTEKMIPHFGKFLLDSGAFTLFSDRTKGKGIVWEEYVDRYADFIVRNNVELFFELDIDKLIGYDKVIELRRRLEKKAGRPCIPVWHKFRGWDNYVRMCDEYKYVSIGGIVSKEIVQKDYKYFPRFINVAHKAGAKIHALGFTAVASLPKYHFDSVDSTAWTTGNRFGAVYYFDGKTMKKRNKGEGQRLKDSRAAAINNFNEWVKYQQYAETHL